MKRLTFLLVAIVAFLATVAPVRCLAAGIHDPSAEKTWEDLRSAIDAGDAKAVASFVGRRISLEAGREQTTPDLVGSAELLDKTWLHLRVITPKRASPATWSLREVQHWTAAFVDFRVLGTVRSIDLKKREMVVDPIRAEVTEAL